MKEIKKNHQKDTQTQDEARLEAALEAMKAEKGSAYDPAKVNLAELERRSGITRAKLRRLKENGFVFTQHHRKGQKAKHTVLSDYTEALDDLLRSGVFNSAVCMERLREKGYAGSLTVLKEYIASHKHLVPAQRQTVAPQGLRARRYATVPGEAFQMDWGFTNAIDRTGSKFSIACFAMVCHHCGSGYIEFFTNARQENLFIGMIHAFRYLGVPEFVLTDNMKSVVLHRDMDGRPVWQKDYEAFMKTVGFGTKLCKPRHPYTKGKVERLVRFVKDNFLAGRTFYNITDLNRRAFDWCEKQNGVFRKSSLGVPRELHSRSCAAKVHMIDDSTELELYLCPLRKISFDGFVNYEGLRFGVPYVYAGKTVRVKRADKTLYIYSDDLAQLLVTHEITWNPRDRYCKDQFAQAEMPEESPSVPIRTHIRLRETETSSVTSSVERDSASAFEKFNFEKEARRR